MALLRVPEQQEEQAHALVFRAQWGHCVSRVGQRSICIVGAAGRTGGHLMSLALERGLEVTAIVRDGRRLNAAGVKVVEGDAATLTLGREVISEGMPVISAVSAPGRAQTTVVSDVTRNLVRSMESLNEAGRLVITSSRNLVATRPWLFVAPTKFAFRHVYTDLTEAEAIVRASTLTWTIARATRLSDGPRRGSVWSDREANATGGDWQLPRQDFAAELLELALVASRERTTVGLNGFKSKTSG